MVRFLIVIACLACGLLLLPSCSRLPQTTEPENLLPLNEIPSEWGELVSALQYPPPTGEVRWNELWFQNEETGAVTYVPVYRWGGFSYDPARVRTFERSSPMAQDEGGAR